MKEVLRKIVLMFLLIFISWNSWSQDRPISGTVVDENGLPLPGVSVKVQDLPIGAVTDFDGNFSFSLPDNPRTILVFSFLGFVQQEIPLGDQSTFHITLLESATGLGEVIVVGYGSTNRENISTAVSTVDVGNIGTRPSCGCGVNLTGVKSGFECYPDVR
ncbi:carboxypeptidase-like regulatory domain-containing protein [Antarcticibacterium sp. 1MA-6-2]|uniref:carboxypeptidase-like regulatory domain-containing protein n=1 Tax=Antarcticibacterium sp. 1MA-6-2 TaxID=2908210 RepID=UPI001F1E1306|nr:carboxypeptidase-like regulatory domain-containing protein [Antarcticibacterium sp. 1MA-6-2]UJH90089.1 carboxypeptidase-like regulatory domain-containing protein [Antarcticibacterium sp. 1MA-6-2]